MTVLVTPIAMALVARERCYDSPVWVFACAALLPSAMLWVGQTTGGHLETASTLRFLGVSTLLAAVVSWGPTRRAEAGICGAVLGALGALAALWQGLEGRWPFEPQLVRVGDVLLTLAALVWFTARTELRRWKKAGLWAAVCAAIGVALVMQPS